MKRDIIALQFDEWTSFFVDEEFAGYGWEIYNSSILKALKKILKLIKNDSVVWEINANEIDWSYDDRDDELVDYIEKEGLTKEEINMLKKEEWDNFIKSVYERKTK